MAQLGRTRQKDGSLPEIIREVSSKKKYHLGWLRLKWEDRVKKKNVGRVNLGLKRMSTIKERKLEVNMLNDDLRVRITTREEE